MEEGIYYVWIQRHDNVDESGDGLAVVLADGNVYGATHNRKYTFAGKIINESKGNDSKGQMELTIFDRTKQNNSASDGYPRWTIIVPGAIGGDSFTVGAAVTEERLLSFTAQGHKIGDLH